jgi:hypothetical protein
VKGDYCSNTRSIPKGASKRGVFCVGWWLSLSRKGWDRTPIGILDQLLCPFNGQEIRSVFHSHAAMLPMSQIQNRVRQV